MKLVYINDELATGDGSNSHAVGLMRAFTDILGQDNVITYPRPVDGSQMAVNLKAGKLRSKLKGLLAFIRFFRKKILSVKRSKEICADLNSKGFIPTHVIARATDFDITAIYVAQKYNARLVYEVNSPTFYERGVIKKEPMIGALEKWERRIINASDKVYVVSNVCRDMLCEHYGIDKDKFIVIPNGYMADLYTESADEKKKIRDVVRKKEGISDKFTVTFVGSLKTWHGIIEFCETAKLMQDNKNISFLVIGDGEMHDTIQNYVQNHSNMIFKGKMNLENMKKYLYASDLGIMPYVSKDKFYYSPLKMFDMIGSGLPFVGTSVGQVQEICESELSFDFLTDTNKSEDLRKRIEALEGSSELDQMRIKVQEYSKKASWNTRAQALIDQIN